MEKPQTLSVKEWIIRNMSTKSNVPERIIEAVVNHQFISAGEAMKVHNSLEFSGFGKFYFNQKKAFHKMNTYTRAMEIYKETLLDNSITEKKRHSTEVRIMKLGKDIEALKPKMRNND